MVGAFVGSCRAGAAGSLGTAVCCAPSGALGFGEDFAFRPQTINVGQETRPSVGPQSRPAARVTLLWSGGRRGAWAPAADLPPFPDRARRGAGAVERGGLEMRH